MENKNLSKFKDFLNSGTPKAKLTQAILCVLAISSLPALVFMAAAMGNAVQIFKMFETTKRFNKNQIRSSLNHLHRQKLIEYVAEKDGKIVVRITKKGETRLRAFEIELVNIPKQKKWDGKWRLVMYDLPLRFKKAREELRWKLKELGFYQFQKSAWIYPYPCEDEIIFIADFFGLGKYVEILTVDNILRDEKIKKYFYLG